MKRLVAATVLLIILVATWETRVPNTQYPADFIAQFQDVLRRLDAIERQPPSTLADITTSPDLAGTAAAAYTSSWTDLAHTNVSFTLTRVATVLILGHIAFAGEGGTANYAEMRLKRAASGAYADNLTLTDVAAVGQATNTGYFYASSTPYIVETLAAGSYYVTFQYRMVGGATTTLNAATPTLNVFLTGG